MRDEGLKFRSQIMSGEVRADMTTESIDEDGVVNTPGEARM
jgi:hypothetical protein